MCLGIGFGFDLGFGFALRFGAVCIAVIALISALASDLCFLERPGFALGFGLTSTCAWLAHGGWLCLMQPPLLGAGLRLWLGLRCNLCLGICYCTDFDLGFGFAFRFGAALHGVFGLYFGVASGFVPLCICT